MAEGLDLIDVDAITEDATAWISTNEFDSKMTDLLNLELASAKASMRICFSQ